MIPEHGHRQLDTRELLDLSSNRHRHHRVEAQLGERPVRFEFGLRQPKFAGEDCSQPGLKFTQHFVSGHLGPCGRATSMHAEPLDSTDGMGAITTCAMS